MLGIVLDEEDWGKKQKCEEEKQRVDVEKNQRYLSAAIAILYFVNFIFGSNLLNV